MTVLYERAGARVELLERCVLMRVEGPHACASHAPLGGALRATRTVAIHETRNDELTLEVDAVALLEARMAAIDPRGVAMLTSRRVSAAVVVDAVAPHVPHAHQVPHAPGPELRAVALVTAGLSNAVRVGDAPGPLAGWGTINIACRVSVPLTAPALLEAMAIAVEARTAAVIEAGEPSRRSARRATGTGTDCVAVLAPEGPGVPEPYAGKHTALGHVIGDAVYRATAQAIAAWQRDVPREARSREVREEVQE